MPRWAIQYDELIPPQVAEEHNKIDLTNMVPGVSGVLCIPHPLACEALAAEATAAGAEMQRGVTGAGRGHVAVGGAARALQRVLELPDVTSHPQPAHLQGLDRGARLLGRDEGFEDRKGRVVHA